MKRILLCLFLFYPSMLLADNFSWTPPATRVDGSPIDPAVDIKAYKIYRGTGLVAANLAKPNATTAPPTSYNLTPPLGTTNYWVTAVDPLDRESPASNVLTVVVTPTPTHTPTPTNTPLPGLSAPTDFTRN